MNAENRPALKCAVIGVVRGMAHIVNSLGPMLSCIITLSVFNLVHTSCSYTEMEHN